MPEDDVDQVTLLQERVDRLEQAFINFAASAGAPDQYRVVLADLGLTPPEPVSGGSGFQRAAKR